MSVRSRIEKFESLSRDQEQGNSLTYETTNSNKKRFQLPGKNSEADSQTTGASFVTVNKSPQKIKDGFQDFEADLQEVWSVRKNIHHTGAGGKKQHVPSSNSASSLPGKKATAGLYSRHGAIPTRQPTHQSTSKGPFNRGSGDHIPVQATVESKRTPLQDFNSKESPWNVKKGGYTYNFPTSVDGMAKRPIGSPKAADLPFVPAAKRRTNIGGKDVMRSNADLKAPGFPLRPNPDTQNDKVSYAKKMAQGYLKSMGIGEFTPKADSYSKGDSYSKQNSFQSNGSNSHQSTVTRWRKLDDDQEFDFDI